MGVFKNSFGGILLLLGFWGVVEGVAVLACVSVICVCARACVCLFVLDVGFLIVFSWVFNSSGNFLSNGLKSAM